MPTLTRNSCAQGSTFMMTAASSMASTGGSVRMPMEPASPLHSGQRGALLSQVTISGCSVTRSPEGRRSGSMPQQTPGFSFPSPSSTSWIFPSPSARARQAGRLLLHWALVLGAPVRVADHDEVLQAALAAGERHVSVGIPGDDPVRASRLDLHAVVVIPAESALGESVDHVTDLQRFSAHSPSLFLTTSGGRYSSLAAVLRAGSDRR